MKQIMLYAVIKWCGTNQISLIEASKIKDSPNGKRVKKPETGKTYDILWDHDVFKRGVLLFLGRKPDAELEEKKEINKIMAEASSSTIATPLSQSLFSSLSLSTSSLRLEAEILNKIENETLKRRMLLLEGENEELRKKIKLLEEEVENLKEGSDVTAVAEKIALQAVHETFVKMKTANKKCEKNENVTPVDNDNVELGKGTGIFIKKHDKQLALAFSQMNIHAAEEKAASYFSDKSKKEKKLPPLFTINKEPYKGPYDPLKLIKFLLRLLFSPEELSKFSANGKRVSSGGNEGLPRKELEAVLAFTHEHCPEVVLSSRHINDAVNSVCSYARKKLAKQSKEDDAEGTVFICKEEIEELTF